MTVPESIGLSGTGHVQPLRCLMVSSTVAALASAMTATDIAVTFAPVADSGGLGWSLVLPLSSAPSPGLLPGLSVSVSPAPGLDGPSVPGVSGSGSGSGSGVAYSYSKSVIRLSICATSFAVTSGLSITALTAFSSASFQSTHPVRGATCVLPRPLPCDGFQSTHPVRGATARMDFISQNMDTPPIPRHQLYRTIHPHFPRYANPLNRYASRSLTLELSNDKKNTHRPQKP